MKSLCRGLAALAFLFAALAQTAAAQYTTVTATELRAGNAPITLGTVSFWPRNASQDGQPIALTGGGLLSTDPFVCHITAGAIDGAIAADGITVSGACQVPDEVTSSPSFLYDITVTNTSTGLTTSGHAYKLAGVSGVTGTTWALDHYTPTLTAGNIAVTNAVVYRGVYNAEYGYAVNDLVTDSGESYISLVSANIGHAPASSPTQWQSIGGTGGGGGGGSMTYPAASGVTIYNAGAGTWGTSLAPTVTIDSTVCNLGSSCTLPTLPGSETRYLQAAVCNGGVAYSSAFSTYDNQQPQFGCIAPATSTAAYMDFQAAASAPQYASLTFAPPPYWTDSDLILTFAGTATTGNVSWIVDVGCTSPNGDLSAPTYGSSFTSTTAVSTTALGLVNSAKMTGIAVPGANGCTAGTTSAGSLVTVRIHRSASDTAAGDAHLIGAILTSDRSQ